MSIHATIRTLALVGLVLFVGATLVGCSSMPSGDLVVPNVIGMSPITRVVDTIARSGLRDLPIPVTSSKPAGTIVSETPSAGTTVRRGTTIRFYYASGSTATTG